MPFVADLHIHSHYSISTSPQLTPEYLDLWGAIKGLAVVGTGDFTHPGWLSELERCLEPAEEGLYRLRPQLRRAALAKAEAEGLPVPAGGHGSADKSQGTRFLLSAEISNIYRRDGATRKVHNLILVPDFASARRLQRQLDGRGNLSSDGRPILGLDSRDLLEITLEACPKALFVPAHIWTPWFSALGAKSGFDRIEDCYADLAGHIHAVETGLSSDPPMNWLCSSLDRYTLISNSDAHSPEKLAREANLFATELSYPAMAAALAGRDPGGFAGTLELFPQEGKYHFDGHRKCRVCQDPLETLAGRGVCPVCGKALTVGVLNRVSQLADRSTVPDPGSRRPFHALIPLKEILSEIHGVGPSSREVARRYGSLITRAGPELAILLELPIGELTQAGGELLGEAIRRMRKREVRVEPGFDGEYGSVRLFAPAECRSGAGPELRFSPPAAGKGEARDSASTGAAGPHPPGGSPERPLVSFDVAAYHRLRDRLRGNSSAVSAASPRRAEPTPAVVQKGPEHALTEPQAAAAAHGPGPALVLAGPGAGKTRTLAARISALVREQAAAPQGVLAVTFTNKAAGEMRERLQQLPGTCAAAPTVTICTFHALGRSLLAGLLARPAEPALELRPDPGRRRGFPILDQDDRAHLVALLPACAPRRAAAFSEAIGAAKQRLLDPESVEDPQLSSLYRQYQERLAELGAFDLDDLLFEPVRRLSAAPALAARLRERYPWVLVDEYQDINEAQYRLVRLLAPDRGANLWVVGDPDQAIYGFRGADVRFIRRFLEDYPGAAVYRLSESFRCSGTILRASAQMLAATPAASSSFPSDRPEPLRPAPGVSPGLRIRIGEYPTEASEAEAVARSIEAMIGGLRFFSLDSQISEGQAAEGIQSLSDFAVLCRIGRQMPALERSFRDHAIPYQKAESEPFWRLEPARSLLRLARALTLPVTPDGARGLATEALLPGLAAEARGVLENMAREYSSAAQGSTPAVRDLLARLAGLCPAEDPEAREALSRLLEYCEPFGHDLARFLEHTALGSGADALQSRQSGSKGSQTAGKGQGEVVSLLTLHAAKGLEFTCVYIVGCEAGLLPYTLLPDQQCDFEEERRLFYVGMTRARRYLYLSHARRRRLFGRELRLPRSPLVDAIERDLTELEEPAALRPPRHSDGQLDLF